MSSFFLIIAFTASVAIQFLNQKCYEGIRGFDHNIIKISYCVKKALFNLSSLFPDAILFCACR